MGHNYYGEPAWPNDLLYIFPVVILGTIACNVGLAVLEPSMIGEPADPFATPLEILPEWYFFPVFQILRTVPNKLLGVLLMVSVPLRNFRYWVSHTLHMFLAIHMASSNDTSLG
ncbi:hypothetical protein V6Z11_A09G123500 [Gossypium hirsutum]